MKREIKIGLAVYMWWLVSLMFLGSVFASVTANNVVAMTVNLIAFTVSIFLMPYLKLFVRRRLNEK